MGRVIGVTAKRVRRNQAVDEAILRTQLMAIGPHKQAGHSMKNDGGA